MEKKKIIIDIDKTKPIKIELTKGSIFLINKEDISEVEFEYSTGNELIPELIFEKNENNFITFKDSEGFRIKAVFYLPKENKIFAHIFSGDIIIEEIQNELNLQADNGQILIKKCLGKITATNLNGEIKINESSGSLNLESINGSIKINNWLSEGGNIHSNNGNIIIGLKKSSKDIDIMTKNGKIILGLEKNNPCTVIARGQDVIKYIEDTITGNSLGSPAKIEWEGGGNKIQAFSTSGKVIITKFENLLNIAPDLESFFKEFESMIRENLNFDSLAKGFKEFGVKIEKWGKNFAENMKDIFSDVKTNKEKTKESERKPDAGSERLEILKMLKEGKITVEEAEKLLKAIL